MRIVVAAGDGDDDGDLEHELQLYDLVALGNNDDAAAVSPTDL